MSDSFVIVGSGASGVHFAQTALEAGRRVVMLDVGWQRPQPVRADADLATLKAELDDVADAPGGHVDREQRRRRAEDGLRQEREDD